MPGFVLRARPSGVHSWRVQLPDRRWLTLGRVDEVAVADAREAAQQRRAKAALGVEIPGRKARSDITLTGFLDQHYEVWMKATQPGCTGQVDRIRWAFKDMLDLKLSEITAGRLERGAQHATISSSAHHHRPRKRRGRWPEPQSIAISRHSARRSRVLSNGAPCRRIPSHV
jgi:hypothetical protein